MSLSRSAGGRSDRSAIKSTSVLTSSNCAAVYSRTDLLGIWMFLLPEYGFWDREAAVPHALVPRLLQTPELLHTTRGTSRDVFWYGREVPSRSGRREP